MAGICTCPSSSPYPIEKIGDSPYPYPYPVNAGIPRQNGNGFGQYPRGRVCLPSLVVGNTSYQCANFFLEKYTIYMCCSTSGTSGFPALTDIRSLFYFYKSCTMVLIFEILHISYNAELCSCCTSLCLYICAKFVVCVVFFGHEFCEILHFCSHLVVGHFIGPQQRGEYLISMCKLFLENYTIWTRPKS